MMKVMRGFKRMFTSFTTASPQFIVANMLRDSIQSAALGKMSLKNNALTGAWRYSDKNPVMRQMLAGGGSFSFGHIYGDDPDAIGRSIDREMRNANIISSPKHVGDVILKAWQNYQTLSNRAENANRMAIYEQALKDGKSHFQASFESRDLMDFSSRGAWIPIRILTDVVPFLNARLQGLDVLARKGMVPTARALFSDGTTDDKVIAARFGTVMTAVTLASMALFMSHKDDEDFKKREDWDRDTYWWFKIGDSAFKIPKPFEIGAVGTMAERALELMVNDEFTGKDFSERFGSMLWNTFAFNPTPQMIKPLYDVYSNKDSFTGRNIESLGMRRLSPSNRERANTTSVAKTASDILENTFGTVLGKDSSLVLSPVQVDYLIQNYLGWVGSMINGTVDSVINYGDKPTKYWHEYQPMRRFFQKLPSGYSRYVTDFYNELKELNQVQSDINNYIKLQEFDKAKELRQEHGGRLRYRKAMNRVSREITETNKRIVMIRRSAMSQDVKRERIDGLRKYKAKLVERFIPGKA